MILHIKGVQNSAEFDLKCTTETYKIETGRGVRPEAFGVGVRGLPA